jgi:ribosomal protein S27E
MKILTAIKWFLQNRCPDCGGKIIDWSSRKAYCEDCGKMFK